MARLFLVDDEPALRRGLAGFLRLAGHEVREAAGVAEALALAAEAPPELLVTDLRLADGTGLELAAGLHRRRGPVPVVLITGYAEEKLRRGGAPGIAAVLEKPVRPRELGETVRRVLAAAPPAGVPPPPAAAAVETAAARSRRRLRLALWGGEEGA